jgi:hypothetical protein
MSDKIFIQFNAAVNGTVYAKGDVAVFAKGDPIIEHILNARFGSGEPCAREVSASEAAGLTQGEVKVKDQDQAAKPFEPVRARGKPQREVESPPSSVLGNSEAVDGMVNT